MLSALRRTLKPPLIFIIPTSFYTANAPIPEIPTSAYYDALINQAGRKKDFAAVRLLLHKRMRDNCFNTNNTFKFISTDLSVLDELLDQIALLEKGFTRRSAYDCLIARLSKLRNTREAMRVAEAMVRNGDGATAATFHPILNALTRRKDMEGARRVMEAMALFRIQPDVTAYNYVLTAHCFVGDVTPAANVVVEMEEKGLEADTRTYDALVLGACRAGRVDGALALLRRMLDDGLPVLYSTHAHIIGQMLRMGYHAQAVEFVMSYAGRDVGLDSENFGLLASRLVNFKKFDEAKIVVKEMRQRGLGMGDKLKAFYEEQEFMTD